VSIITKLKLRLKAVSESPNLSGPQAELKARLDAKDVYWFSPDAPSQVKALASLASDKLLMRRYVSSLGLRLPQLYHDAGELDEIDFAGLPDRIVIKPHNGWNSDAVMLIDGERELLSGARISRASLPAFCRKNLAAATAAKNPRIIVEEFVQDYDRQFAIPRDFKVYVAGGMPWIIQVIDRNGSKKKRRQAFYNHEWTRFEDPFQMTYLEDRSVPPPPLLHRLVADARTIAADLNAFLRLDFYLSPTGPVFGEITWSPFAGVGFTRFGAEYLCGLMDRYPDNIRADLA
jgi:hypothetical protein